MAGHQRDDAVMNTAAGDPFAPFEAWTAKEMADAASGAPRPDRTRRFTFTPATAKVYRTIWKGWITWLASEGLQWNQATSAQVRKFLSGPTPGGEGVGRNPIDKRKMANYTQQRYWRVLRGVYALAFPSDPSRNMSDLEEKDRPKVQARSRTSQVLPPGVLQALQDPKMLAVLVPRESSTHWWIARDRAAMALLVHCALTTAEIIALRADDLMVGNAPLRPDYDQQHNIPSVQDPFGPRVNISQGMERTVPLPPEALINVMPWLQERSQLLYDRLGLPLNGPDAAAMPLFLSRQKENGKLTSMEPTSIWQMVSRCLRAALQDPSIHVAVDSSGRVAKGAAIVRNSVLQRWLWIDKRSPADVARLAGLKSIASLRLPLPDTAKDHTA